MDEAFLEILCCPITHQPLRLADARTLERVRTQSNHELSEALVREDGQTAYPVVNGIPLLVPEEAIAL